MIHFKIRKQFALLGLVMSTIIFVPSVKAEETMPLRGFTDFSYIYDNAAGNNSFQIHDFDLFLARPIDKKVNILAEVNFQPDNTGIGVDLERTFVQYTVDPWLKIAVGRYHTALGYWNETYHHGSYLQTSVTRPTMVRFEDTGGILPTHTTGLEFRGNGPIGTGNFGYIFDVGNGRGPIKDPPAFFNSFSKSKSVSGLAYYEMDNGLRYGANFYVSKLPGGPNQSGTTDSLGNVIVGPEGNELILGAHVVYNTPTIEWLNEYDHLAHNYIHGSANSDGSTSTSIHVAYSQFGYHLGLFTPYVRYELNATDHPDAYQNSANQPLLATTRYYVVGTRYELSAASALKVEGTMISSNALIADQFGNGTSDTLKTDYIVNFNWSLGF